MSDSNFWSVDRVAANNLLADLKLEATADILETVTKHFAQNRQSAIGWAAERSHSYVIRKMESVSSIYFDRKNAEWTDGFRFAQHQIAIIRPQELLELGSDKARTKGQVLRALVRHARSV